MGSIDIANAYRTALNVFFMFEVTGNQ